VILYPLLAACVILLSLLVFPPSAWMELLRLNRKWYAGMPDSPVDPKDDAVVAAVARGLGTPAGEAARLNLTPIAKHTKAKEGRTS
jgi:hypothetical protein